MFNQTINKSNILPRRIISCEHADSINIENKCFTTLSCKIIWVIYIIAISYFYSLRTTLNMIIISQQLFKRIHAFSFFIFFTFFFTLFCTFCFTISISICFFFLCLCFFFLFSIIFILKSFKIKLFLNFFQFL